MKRVLCLGFVVLLGVGVVACGDDGGSSSGSDDSTTDDASASASNTEALGEPNPATGEPVKVGLLTNGGDCPTCTTGDDEPVAEATVAWLNEYMGGVGGRPIELVVCVDDIEPSKAVDCANEMIREGVVAVVVGSSGTVESSWPAIHDAGIPYLNYSSTVEEVLQDDQSTFVFQDPQASTLQIPVGVAEDVGAEKVTNIVIDVPAATEIYDEIAPEVFEEADLEFDVVTVPLGTPDMTPQAREVVADNPEGVVMIIGHDQFCIPAINGLTAAGFDGTTATIQHCVTDAMRDALPSDAVEGIVISANAPIGDDDDASWIQYNAVLDTYNAPDSVDREDASPLSVYITLGALSVGTQQLEGEVTPESVIAALRAMPNSVLPGSGGRHFQCDGEASDTGPAVCTASVLSAELDAEGNTINYQVINDVTDEAEE